MNDPWKNRSEGMKCRTCMWFVDKNQDAGKGVAAQVGACNGGPDRGYLGRCRRHAPTMSGFPAVFTKDWCGDHKLDETKI